MTKSILLILALYAPARAASVNTAAAPTTPVSVANGGTASATAGAARTALSAAGSGANTDITSLSFGGGVTISTPPFQTASAVSWLATLASGATFFQMPSLPYPIKLVGLSHQVLVASIGGTTGDNVDCNGATTAKLRSSTASSAAALTFATKASGSIAIAAADTVSCHLESDAATRPILQIALQYIPQ